MTDRIDPHEALIYTMVLAAAAEGDINDDELAAMTAIVSDLPAFREFDRHRVTAIGQNCAHLLRDTQGLDRAFELIADALPGKLRETAYALACDVIAADARASDTELRLLELIRNRLEIDRLAAVAIEFGARARHRLV